ncbi:MAG: chromosome partitioning protein ParB [Gammaproteobacteria bacterium]|nr:MAG: chromosome partitioning protein ParB [Gammaproteobacteria bacterium]
MAAKKRGLGRGLDALLGSSTVEFVSPSDKDGDLAHLPVEFLQRSQFQPRKDFSPESLQELADSIKSQGVIQPIVVRLIDTNKYEIIAGERRWRATQLAQLDTIPAVVRKVTDEAAFAIALIENIQRENLNPIEEAAALQRLQEKFELTHQQVAEAVGKSRATVSNLLRLMSLDEVIKTMLERGDLEMGHARALLSLANNDQRKAGKLVAAKNLSVRQTEALVRKMLADQENPSSTQQTLNPDVQLLQESLSEKLGAAVNIQYNARGKGKLVITYNSLDELDGILSHID